MSVFCGTIINVHLLICMYIPVSSYACSTGYFGPNCSLPCRHPNYGDECQFECVCGMKNCNHITGCQHSNDSMETNTTLIPLEGRTSPFVLNDTTDDGSDCLSIGTNTSKSANQEAMKITIWSMTFLTFVLLAIYFKLSRKKSLKTADLI
ncbi:uncharacterized protein LOC144623503 isoform X2 [Crassostrea virginica]